MNTEAEFDSNQSAVPEEVGTIAPVSLTLERDFESW
jgi:hypothetical protein